MKDRTYVLEDKGQYVLMPWTSGNDLAAAALARECVIAGGFARQQVSGIPANDIDIFPLREHGAFESMEEYLLQNGYIELAEERKETANTYIRKEAVNKYERNHAVQIVRPGAYGKFYAPRIDVADVLDSFDLVNCRAAIVKDGILVDQRMPELERQKQVLVANVKNPLRTIFRVIKQSRHNYWIMQSEMLRLLMAYDHMTSLEKEGISSWAARSDGEWTAKRVAKRLMSTEVQS